MEPANNTVWCIYCRESVPADAPQCLRCHKPLNDKSRVVRCPQCGKYILKSDVSCRHCHADLTAAPAAPAAPVETPVAPTETPVETPAAESAPAAAPQDDAHENLDAIAAAHDEAEQRAAEAPRVREPMSPERKRQLLGVGGAVLAVLLLVGCFLLGRSAGKNAQLAIDAEAIATVEQAKKENYEAGYVEGFAAGNYDLGYDTGYAEGFREGSLAGYSAGFDEGQDFGAAAGPEAGRAQN